MLYMIRVVPSTIIRSANNCIYSIWYLSQRYCYLPLSWKSWNRSECAVGGVQYLSNIPGKHEIKELQTTAILGTAQILREVLI